LYQILNPLDIFTLDILSFKKYKYIPITKSMNILNFINFKNYYCQLDSNFQIILKSKIKNYSKIARKLKISSNTISRILNLEDYWINFSTLFSFSTYVGIKKKEVFLHIKKVKTKNSFPIDFQIKNLISPAFFRVIGHILGDGGIHVLRDEGKYRAFYVNNEHNLLDSFSNDIIYLFGKVQTYKRTREKHGDEIWLPTTIGYLLYEILNYKKTKDKRVPNFILKTKNPKLIGPFLQALYDDDGYLYPRKNMIVFSQKRRKLLEEIRKVIENIGIIPNKILVHNAKNRTRMYYFSITSRENILKFSELVGFKHPIKNNKLQLLVEKYGGRL
jgi:hypothetical protein